MIQATSFLNMPLRTKRQRRTIVVLYYALLLFFLIVGLYKSRGSIGFLAPQIVLFGGLLGGIKAGGPVKPYSEAAVRGADTNSLQTLNLEGRKPFGVTFFERLDERERGQRDLAHYKAYRILMLTLGIVFVVYWISLDWTYMWIATKGPVLTMVLLVYVLSLPQSVLLWSEPDALDEPTLT
jgi:hypothetical protein